MFIEQSLDEWLKLGVVKCPNTLYNSPIFCILKKQGQGLQVVQDFHELNNHSHIYKYLIKEITEYIGDIRCENSTIFLMLDLTSGSWQMQLGEDSQPLTVFTEISMDYIARGSTRMLGQSPMPNGRSARKHFHCHCVHWWLAGAHQDAGRTFKNSGPHP